MASSNQEENGSHEHTKAATHVYPFLQLTQSPADVDVFIPDGRSTLEHAMTRTTHLGIGAHPDDLEFMALAGILECFDHGTFGGVTVTDGAGSARAGPYAAVSDAAMTRIRSQEQRKAAMVGNYSFLLQLGHASRHVKQIAARQQRVVADLKQIIRATRPRIVYTHNPFDKHATHVGVCLATLQAIRELPAACRPAQLMGCEVWRGLDWLSDKDANYKVATDVSARPNLAAALNGVYDSQIAGGKRYDEAVAGRRRANATFMDSHTVDAATAVQLAVDMTELVNNPELTVKEFCQARLQRFQQDVLGQLESLEEHGSSRQGEIAESVLYN